MLYLLVGIQLTSGFTVFVGAQVPCCWELRQQRQGLMLVSPSLGFASKRSDRCAQITGGFRDYNVFLKVLEMFRDYNVFRDNVKKNGCYLPKSRTILPTGMCHNSQQLQLQSAVVAIIMTPQLYGTEWQYNNHIL